MINFSREKMPNVLWISDKDVKAHVITMLQEV